MITSHLIDNLRFVSRLKYLATNLSVIIIYSISKTLMNNEAINCLIKIRNLNTKSLLLPILSPRLVSGYDNVDSDLGSLTVELIHNVELSIYLMYFYVM